MQVLSQFLFWQLEHHGEQSQALRRCYTHSLLTSRWPASLWTWQTIGSIPDVQLRNWVSHQAKWEGRKTKRNTAAQPLRWNGGHLVLLVLEMLCETSKKPSADTGILCAQSQPQPSRRKVFEANWRPCLDATSPWSLVYWSWGWHPLSYLQKMSLWNREYNWIFPHSISPSL